MGGVEDDHAYNNVRADGADRSGTEYEFRCDRRIVYLGSKSHRSVLILKSNYNVR